MLIGSGGCGSARAAGHPRLAVAAGRLPGGVDLVDQLEQLLRVVEVGRGLDLADLLVRVPEQLVEVRDGLEVLGLEVVVPQDVEVVLDEVGLLLLDRDRARPEGRVLVGGVLLDDPVAGLGLDAGLLGVVDAARQVAVGVGDGRRGEQSGDERHRATSGSGAGVPVVWSGRSMARAGKCPGPRWACQTRDGIRITRVPIIGVTSRHRRSQMGGPGALDATRRREPRPTRVDAVGLERADRRRLRAVRGGPRGPERAAAARASRSGRDLLRPRGAVRLHARDR